MKTSLITTIILLIMSFSLLAQTDSVQGTNAEFEEMIESLEPETTGTDTLMSLDVKTEKDTIRVRVGNTKWEIVPGDKKTHIDVETMDGYQSKWDKEKWEEKHFETVHKSRKKKFDGHWSGIDFGGNQLWNTNYSMYPEGTPVFLETRPEKSFEFNWNFAEYSFGFGSYVGIVTGLGLNFNDYKFKNNYTLVKDENGMIQPLELPNTDLRKTKLSTAFLTAPLMLEFQIPGNHGQDRLFIAGGLIGGVKLGEHTKTKIGTEKTKDKGDHNIAPLRWGYTARVGFDDVGIFATYYNTLLFENGKGPETTPLTIGLTFTF
ncbi:MAG: outer membrane beta-barrel protein [Prolixibacteraceae bacterium]|nr:outer membrane beta-barrel protein [Prolixibacteraceae bacterium]